MDVCERYGSRIWLVKILPKENVENLSFLVWIDDTSCENVNFSKVRDYLHGEHSYGPLSSHWIVTESDKYIWNSDSGKEEYFNLDVDPREMNECSASNTARTTQLRNILIKELKNRKEGFVKDGCLIAGVPYPPYIK